MKRFLSILALCALALAACTEKDSPGEQNPSSGDNGGGNGGGAASEVNSIEVGSNSIELADLTSKGEAEFALIPLTLSPSNVRPSNLELIVDDGTYNQVKAEIVDGDPMAVKITIPANTTHAETKVRSAKVTVKAKSGSASSAVITVGVRGHVYGLALDPPALNLENGEIHITSGEGVSLNPTLTKTGQLKTGGDKVTYSCSSGISVSSGNVLTCSSSSFTGASTFLTLKARCGSSPEIEYKVHTYAAPTGFVINSHRPSGLENKFKVGTNYIISITVQPSTARQSVSCQCSLDKNTLERSFQYASTMTQLYIKPLKSLQNQASFEFSSGSYKETWNFSLNDYDPGDVKVGDYVYRTSSGGISRSDGGLRAVGNGQAWIRKDYVNSSVPSGGELIGIIFDPSPSFIESLPSNMKAGIKGDDGVTKHVGVVAVQDAATGNSTKTCTWGNSTISWGGDSNTPKSTVSNTYKLYTLTYAKGTAVTFNSLLDNFKNTLKLPSSGTTPWMLPGYVDFEQMSTYGEVLFKNKAGLTGSYWTACTDGNSSQSWAATWDSSKYTFSLGQYPRANAHKLRPVFFL